MDNIKAWFVEVWRIVQLRPVGGFEQRIVLLICGVGFVAGALLAKAKLLKGILK